MIDRVKRGWGGGRLRNRGVAIPLNPSILILPFILTCSLYIPFPSSLHPLYPSPSPLSPLPHYPSILSLYLYIPHPHPSLYPSIPALSLKFIIILPFYKPLNLKFHE
jgi:hypothetical protein